MSKITIVAYKKNDYSGKVDKWEGNYNPSDLKLEFNNQYISNPAIGSAMSKTYVGPKPAEMTFPLLFENSYAASWKSPKVDPVKKQVEAFIKLTYTINGDAHEANFLELTCGDFLFKGQVTSVSVNYSAFNTEGIPIRALVNLTILKSQDAAASNAEIGKNSPDLSHSVVVKQGDSLAGIAFQYYGDPLYYIELAQVNQITDFREIKAGTRIVVPPLEN